MFYINYDRFDPNNIALTIHREDCLVAIETLVEPPKRTLDGYWLWVRRMEDAMAVTRDLGVIPTYPRCCRPLEGRQRRQ